MMELTSEGKKTLNKLNFLAKQSPELGDRILTEFGEGGLKEAKKRCPIDTASLVSTGRTKKGPGYINIIFGGMMALFSRKGRDRKYVDYAKYVNDGTSNRPGKFFLERGAYAAFSNLASIGRKALDNWLSKIK